MNKVMEYLLLILVLILMGCESPDDSRSALQKSGFTDIQITGWEPFTCGQDDTYSTGFIATNPTGQKVSGVVCCGLWTKSCTVRF